MFFKKKIWISGKNTINTWKLNDNTFLNKIRKNLLSRKVDNKPALYRFFVYFFVLFILFFLLKWFLYFFDNSAWKISQYFFKPMLSDVQTDENGFVNILLIWAWWWDHDWANLTDTLILVSIDLKWKNITMLSFPRDLYLKYDEKYRSSRINEIFRNTITRLEKIWIEEKVARKEARKILVKQIEKISWMKIPYNLQIDFKWFEKIVDSLWWVDILVPNTIVDTTYPDWNWWYETFSIKKWERHLSWEIALKYARSRHSSSDFDRAARQQLIISAIKEKAFSSEILTSPHRIKKLLNIVSDNIETNLEFGEIFTLASFSWEFSRDSVFNAVLNDDANTKWWFLTTPARVNYWGAFVLIPYSWKNDFSRIQLFSDFIFKNRKMTKMKIEILNSTSWIPWVATKVWNRLWRYWININSVWNWDKDKILKKTEIIIYNSDFDSEIFKEFWIEIFPKVDVKFIDKVWYYEETNIDMTINIWENIRF